MYNNVRAKVIRWNSVISGDVIGKGMESANNYARKWSILPFDVSRDFIKSKDILVYFAYNEKLFI